MGHGTPGLTVVERKACFGLATCPPAPIDSAKASLRAILMSVNLRIVSRSLSLFLGTFFPPRCVASLGRQLALTLLMATLHRCVRCNEVPRVSHLPFPLSLAPTPPLPSLSLYSPSPPPLLPTSLPSTRVLVVSCRSIIIIIFVYEACSPFPPAPPFPPTFLMIK